MPSRDRATIALQATPAGSSALMPRMRVRSPTSAHPAMSPACVPPDDVAWTMTSGLTPDCREFDDAAGEAERAGRRGRAERHDERAAAGSAHFRGDPLHHRRPILATGHVTDLGAEESVQSRVRGRLSLSRPVQHEHDFQPERGARGRGHARVIRLHAAARDERVGAVPPRPPPPRSCIFLTLLPPRPNDSRSSRLMKRRGEAGRARARAAPSSSIGVACGASETTGSDISAASAVAMKGITILR